MDTRALCGGRHGAGIGTVASLAPRLPGLDLTVARLQYWSTGLGVAASHPLLGAPRSTFLEEFGYEVIWNPHNGVLWLIANFGIVGLAAYCAYALLVMTEFARAAQTSRLWLGVLVGAAIGLAWSFTEIIVMTPAFEILLATLYAIARAGRSASAPQPSPEAPAGSG